MSTQSDHLDALVKPERHTAFRIYKRRYLIWVFLLASLVFLLPILCFYLGLKLAFAAGPLFFLGMLMVPLLLNLVVCLGNGPMEQQTRDRLGLWGTEHFVGLGAPDNNTFKAKFMHLRVETDDNVGLVQTEGDALTIHTEGGVLRIPASDILGIEIESMIEFPLTKWVRVRFHDGHSATSILATSRKGFSLSQHRRNTFALHQALVSWHAQASKAPPASLEDPLEREFARLKEALEEEAVQLETTSRA